MPGLDDVTSAVSGAGSMLTGKAAELIGPLSDALAGSGGMSGMLDRLKSGPIAEQVQTWMTDAPNLPVTPEQVQQALRPETLTALAQKSGQSVEQVSATLAESLPKLIETVTSKGSLLKPDQLSGLASSIPGVGKLLGG